LEKLPLAELALTDLIGGQAQVIFATLPATIEYIRAGTVRALAVTTATRSEVLPDIPTMGEFVPGFEGGFGSIATWLALAGTHPKTAPV
jgi:tripartite-type tricarboxylate transporter receptor subunit TctC